MLISLGALFISEYILLVEMQFFQLEAEIHFVEMINSNQDACDHLLH
jgi:hypothetical protein